MNSKLVVNNLKVPRIRIPAAKGLCLAVGLGLSWACSLEGNHSESVDRLTFNTDTAGLVAATPASAQASATGPTECGSFFALPGSQRWVPALPDKAARYDTYDFKVNTGNYQAIRVSGQFPYARYFSLNIYNSQNGANVGVLTDRDILPLPGHTNPFQPGASRGAQLRSYEVYLTEAGSGFVPPAGANVLEFPTGLTSVALVTRVYRADQGLDDLGGVDLPTLTPVAAAGQPTCPEHIPFDPSSIAVDGGEGDPLANWELLLELQGSEPIFIRSAGNGLYPNADNLYLAAALDNSKVTILRFKAPTYEDTFYGSPVFIGGTETRYWSLCIGGLRLTTTSACLEDDRIAVDSQGYVTVVVGPERQRAMTEAAGFGFIPRGNNLNAVIVHRHMLDRTDFVGRLELVPEIPLLLPPDFDQDALAYYDARNSIGEYAPAGQIMTEWEYRSYLRNL